MRHALSVFITPLPGDPNGGWAKIAVLVAQHVDTSDSFCDTDGEPVPMRGAVALMLLLEATVLFLTHFVSFLPEILS